MPHVRDIKKWRIKKDVRIYHPHFMMLLEGTIVAGEMPPIIADENAVIICDDEKIKEYIEEC